MTIEPSLRPVNGFGPGLGALASATVLVQAAGVVRVALSSVGPGSLITSGATLLIYL